MTKNGLNAFCAMALGLMLGCSNGCGGADREKKPLSSPIQAQPQAQVTAPVASNQKADKAPESPVTVLPNADSPQSENKKPQEVHFCGQTFDINMKKVTVDCKSEHVCKEELSAFSLLESLEEIVLVNCERIQTLFPLKRSTHLRYLDTGIMNTYDFSFLCSLTSLEYLKIGTVPSGRTVDFTDISNCSKLVALDISRVSRMAKLEEMGKIQSLKSLVIDGGQIVTLRPFLIKWGHIVSLGIEHAYVEDVAKLPALGSLSELSLVCASREYNDRYPWMGSPPGISRKKRSSRNSRLLEPLRNFPKMEKLSIECNYLGDTDPLFSLSKLKTLNLIGFPVDFDPPSMVLNNLAFISNFKGLETVSLKYFFLENDDYSPLAKVTTLVDLEIYNSDITALFPMERLKNLRKLSLRATKVLDISALNSLEKLEELDLRDTNISDEQIEILKNAKPDLVIHR